ncbi:MAG TPA: Hsp33 family molecular chaperone HslO [Tahibacter sp.]|nr:Hsp33 family molecular chaperone HslO [Tahibacter sp.]
MIAPNDQLHRFLLERAGASGVIVQLEESWQEVAGRDAYPPRLQHWLGQALAACAVLTGNTKLRGSLSIQLKSDGPVRLLFTQCSDEGRLRGLAQWQEPLDDMRDLADLVKPLLAITIENAETGHRYQGLVPVEHGELSHLLQLYFEQSEQLPTAIHLACDGQRCAALLLQPIAQAGGVGEADPDGWNRARHLLATLTDAELLGLPATEVLRRLFHEEDPRLLESRPLHFGCQCSRERVAAVLRNLGRDEAEAAIQADGRVEVTCEFCNTRYHFDRIDLEQVFRALPDAPSSSTPH